MKQFDEVNQFRVRKGFYGSEDSAGNYGAFVIPLAKNTLAFVIASDGEDSGWEHVSVHIRYRNKKGKEIQRTPTWDEMCTVKDLFWRPDEVVMQLHPPECDYVNTHKHCLHLWRPEESEIPVPPVLLV